MTAPDSVLEFAAHVRVALGGGPFPPTGGWAHMGVVLCDAVVQSGLRCEAVVRPRTRDLQAAWPDADTVTGFRARPATEDLGTALRLANARKPATITALAEHLALAGVDTRDHLRAWLEEEAHRSGVRAVHGIGPKTVDYLGSLVGRSGVAVDVHLRAFARGAGVEVTGYVQLREVYEEAADSLRHVNPDGREFKATP
ncbi:hypothetical protein [Streptomyces sp. HB2AG]|uniref:hypothetical protein n=1 Tax=Streptomyces sp. HB2AG TaxID=2983400 RepID=UPI0022AAA155|nr:hypothetical protein [Streptomyces sp. HB2AG]MCZ2528181.1 hypothetical protein [Streptomyces sp. HB2AG]